MATSCIQGKEKNNSEAQALDISWKYLRNTEGVIPVPFQLALTDCADYLLCKKILRIIPGKRLVALGEWGERKIVAKLFYGKNAKLHIKREIEGVEALVAANIPTPKLLWKGNTQEQKIQIVIFEYIDGLSLDVIWQNKKNPEELKKLMEAMTIELATQHVLGIVQNDLHLKNFLIAKKQIYTLDGSSITHFNEILPKEESLKHLALFFSQLGIDTEKLQMHLFDVYIKARSWIIKPADVEFLYRQTLKLTEKRWDNYEKKIHRSCSSFACKKTLNSFIMYDRSYHTLEFQHLLMDPEAIFQHKDTEVLKAGRSSTVVKIQMNNRYYVVKRYNIKDTLHWLRRCLRASRACQSWKLAHRLRLFNISTAKPVAFIEKRILGFRDKSYFIMELVEGPHIGKYFSHYKASDPHFSLLADRVRTLLSGLAKLHLTHGDLKMTNILIENDNPVIIDLDGMIDHHSAYSLKRGLRQEMQRFMQNWENQPAVYELFEKCFLG